MKKHNWGNIMARNSFITLQKVMIRKKFSKVIIHGFLKTHELKKFRITIDKAPILQKQES